MTNTPEKGIIRGMDKRTLTAREALAWIQIFAVLPLLFYGVYMISPWYVVVPSSAAFAALFVSSAWSVKFIGALYLISSVGTIYGAVRGHGKWSKRLLWSSVSMYTLLITVRILTIGFVPFIWVMYLAPLLICGVLALYVGRE